MQTDNATGELVAITVKAPSQQTLDKTLECDTTWTIRQLKEHLAEVYPHNPKPEDQRLIYSGQLLDDASILKDVLRSYDGQTTHTIHLVCSMPRGFRKTPVKEGSATAAAASPPPVTTPTITSTTERDCNEAENNSQRAAPAMNSYFPYVAGNYNPASGIDPQMYTAQIAWMQQAYLYYMNHYVQYYTNQSSPNGIDNPEAAAQLLAAQNASPFAQYFNANGVDAATMAAAVFGARPDNVNEENQNNNRQVAGNNVANAPNGNDRDLLELFYVIGRFMIFVSVVYLYSSPLRFLVVFILGFVIYLYQTGRFPANLEGNQVNNNNNINVNNQNGGNEPDGSAQDDRPPVNVQVEDRPTVISLMWTFIFSFFTSLVPQVPNAI